MTLSDDARRLWDAARRMNAIARASGHVSAACTLPPLLAFTDPTQAVPPWTIAAGLPAGSGLVYRHFGDPEAEAVGRQLRAITGDRGLVLLIGKDADLAERIGADGVHLPGPARQAAPLRRARPDWLLTGAVHDPLSDDAPAELGAAVLSPIFATEGPSRERPALGVGALKGFARRRRAPVYALGGIGPDNVEALANSGAWGIAGVSAFARAFSVRT